MFIIRSYQTTVVDGTVPAVLAPLMDGPNNSVHTGLVIPANTLAPGDTIEFWALLRFDVDQDIMNQTWANSLLLDGVNIFGGSALPVVPFADTPGMFKQEASLHLGNAGFIYQMFEELDTIFVGFMGVYTGNDTAGNMPLLDTAGLTALGGGFARAGFDRTIDHNFIYSVDFAEAQPLATITLISAELRIYQPSNGNTAGR